MDLFKGSGFTVEVQETEKEGLKIFRANLKNKDDAELLLAHYKAASKTDWIVHQEVLNVQKVAFHKYWNCQLSSKNKKDGTKRNKGCLATLDILIKKVNKNTIKNDRDFLGREDPLAGVITFKNEHNHPTDYNHEALGYLRIAPDTAKLFESCFNDGLGPSESRRLHELKLLMEVDGAILIADARLNPTLRTVQHLYDKWRVHNFGPCWSSNPLEKLREKVEAYAAKGTAIHIDDHNEEDWAILVVTPIMLRAQHLQSASEIIFLDSTSSVDSTQSTLTVVLTATGGGAVPIATMIHNRQTLEGYSRAFSLLKNNFPECFGTKTAPEVFMTDHSDAEKGALRQIWEEVDQLLCQFHVAQSEWRWLLKAEHNIKAHDRQSLMGILRKMMYASDTEEFEDALAELNECGYENYQKHVESELLVIKEEWVSLFRTETLNRNHNTNNLSEACIRTLKDIILTRTLAFNVPAMVDFVVNVWDPYLTARLLHFAYNREARPTLLYQELPRRMPSDAAGKIQKVRDDFYLVPSGNAKRPDLMYEVWTLTGWCSCRSGRQGGFCKHQALVYKTFGGEFPNRPPIDAKSRYTLGKLALGEKCPDPSFFIGTNENVSAAELLTSEVHVNSTEGPVKPSLEEENAADLQPSSQQFENDDNETLQSNLLAQMERLLELGAKCSSKETYKSTVRRLTQRLERVDNCNVALSTLLSLSTRSASTRKKGSKMKVQSTTPSRRRPGSTGSRNPVLAGRPAQMPSQNTPGESSTRGCKRAASGRLSSQLPPSKRRTKRPHSLSLSVLQNKSHPKAHGHQFVF